VTSQCVDNLWGPPKPLLLCLRTSKCQTYLKELWMLRREKKYFILFFAIFLNSHLFLTELDASQTNKLKWFDKVFLVSYGRVREL
jgi:hypothetical protein